MGCSSSSGELTKFKVNEFISGQGQRTVNIAKSLGMTDKDLNALFQAFVSFDEIRLKTGHKQQGKEKVEDFFVMNHITTTEIAHHLAKSLYSTNKTGVINFEEFIITSWWIVSLNEEEVAKWIFRLFDHDNDDMLTPAEMKHLVETVGSHNQISMKGLEDCYKHLCFEKVEHKGPMFHGQPMDDSSTTTIKEKSCKLVEWIPVIAKNPNLLKPIYEMQAMLRDKTVRERSLQWQEFRVHTFGANHTLDEIVHGLGMKTSYKPQERHPSVSAGECKEGSKGASPGHGHSHHSESAMGGEEEDHDVKPHHFHPDRKQSITTPTAVPTGARKRSMVAVSSPDSQPGSAHHSHDHNLINSRNGHHPTTASAAHSAHTTPGHTPQMTPRSHLNHEGKHDHHHTGPDKDHIHQQLGNTGKSDSGGTSLSSSKPASRQHSQQDKTSSHHDVSSDKDKTVGAGTGPRRHSKVPTPVHGR